MGRVLQLLGPSTGGIRRHVAELCRVLPEHGWSPVVAGPPGVMEGLGHLDHEVVVRTRPRALLGAVGAVRRAAAGVDVVHAHGLTVGWLAVLARLSVPVVLTVHNVVLDEAAGRAAPLLRRLEGALPGRVDATIAISPGVADRFAPRHACEVIPPAGPAPAPARSPAEVRAGLGVPDGVPLVVCVARLHPQKDLPTLLQAAALLHGGPGPAPFVAIVGEGPLRDQLQARIAELGVEDRVLLAGPRPSAADELAAADVVVMCSRWESGPLVVAEALALARPVVATPVGFVPDLVEDRVSGRLVAVGDAPGLARAIAEVLGDADAAAALGARGRDRVEHVLGSDRLVGRVARVYDRVVPG